MMRYIYVLLDEFGKVRYVGKTNNINRRYKEHLTNKDNTYKSKWVQSMILNDFVPEIKIIGEYTKDTINIWEMFWINHYSKIGCKLTNLTLGGDGGVVIDSVKKQISNTLKEKYITGELVPVFSGKKLSESHINNLQKSHLGQVVTDETRIKLSEFQKNRKHTKEQHENIIKSRCKNLYEITNPDGIIYYTNNYNQFSKQYNLSVGLMSQVLNGTRKHHKNWTIKLCTRQQG